MTATAPLQILLFRHPDDSETAPLEDAIVRAFQGGKDATTYLATGADLGVKVQPFTKVPDIPAKDKLDATCHTLTLVLVGPALQTQLEVSAETPAGHGWLTVGIMSTNPKSAIGCSPFRWKRFWSEGSRNFLGWNSLQVRAIQEFGEFALRSTMLGLLALHEARLVAARALQDPEQTCGLPNGHLRFFISHAKIDGLPLAQALRYQIKSINWLQTFYDADDLPSGSNWKRLLEKGVASSLILPCAPRSTTAGTGASRNCSGPISTARRPCSLTAHRIEPRGEHAAVPRLPIARVPD